MVQNILAPSKYCCACVCVCVCGGGLWSITLIQTFSSYIKVERGFLKLEKTLTDDRRKYFNITTNFMIYRCLNIN